MADFNKVKKDIVANVYENHEQKIMGDPLQKVLLESVGVTELVDTESKSRDEELGNRITAGATNLDALAVRVAANEGNINTNTAGISELKTTTQIKDMDVEIRNVGAGQFVSSDSAAEIHAHAIKGGNVKIQWEDKKYEFVEYRQRTAYFRCISVSADKVTENSIEVYEKQATFKNIEYKAVFDATPLLDSFKNQQPLSEDFIRSLDEALAERRLIYITGDGTTYVLVGTSKTPTIRTFTSVGGHTMYVLSYGTSKIVSLDTHAIGADIHIFNNREGVNILNLTTSSSASEIGDVFTDSFGDKVLPHTGDIFNIMQNSDVAHSGIVASMVEDSAEIRLAVNMSNFEDNLIHRVFYKINFNPSAGFSSLNITQKVENIVDPSKLTEAEIDRINAKDIEQDRKITETNAKDAEQDGKIAGVESRATKLEGRSDVTEADMDALACGIDRAGHFEALSLNSESEIMVCGYPLVVFGKGAPSAVNMIDERMKPLGGSPAFKGQLYIDVTAPSKGLYYAVDNKSVADWRN